MIFWSCLVAPRGDPGDRVLRGEYDRPKPKSESAKERRLKRRKLAKATKRHET